MSESSDDGDGVDAEVPDAVLDWLSSVAAERGMSETELLQSLLAGRGAPGGGGGGDVDHEDLERVEAEFTELVKDVRERIVQVKRETDEKAPSEHTHPELSNNVMQLGREFGSLEAELDQLDEQLAAGFENFEEILTYLTESTDDLDRKFARLASTVIDLREQVGAASREENRRNALAHLTDTANRHGVEKAKCDDCGEGVHIGMLVEPRCPHCDSPFSGLEPKSGFFRKSVLRSGTRPALEAGVDAGETDVEPLEAMVEDAETGGDVAPSFGMEERASGLDEPDDETESAYETETTSPPEPVGAEDTEPTGAKATSIDGEGATSTARSASGVSVTDGQYRLERIDGVGPTYAERLEGAGVDDLLELAVADPEELGEAIDVPAVTVADWVAQADTMTGT